MPIQPNKFQKIVLVTCREFLNLQRELLECWRAINSDSDDVETLLDFPYSTQIRNCSGTWNATKHGVGVRFVRSDALEVDVPYGVDDYDGFDPNRIYDYYQSSQKLSENNELRDRDCWYDTFDRLVVCGFITVKKDDWGRDIYRLTTDKN